MLSVLSTAGSGFWLSPKSRESSAQLGAPKLDKFVEFVASGCMASTNPIRGVVLGAASPWHVVPPLLRCLMCGSPPPWHFSMENSLRD